MNYLALSYKEYASLAARTESPKYHPDKLPVSTIHGIIGIQTESCELLESLTNSMEFGLPIDVDNIREEIGDIIWYVSAVTRSQGFFIDLEKGLTGINSSTILVMNIACIAGSLTDLVKKSFFYGIEPNTFLIEVNTRKLMTYVVELCNVMGFNIKNILAENINKLQARYPNQFNTEDSIKRMDKNEAE